MEKIKPGNHSRPVITQTKNNTTIWIGHLKADPYDHSAGQTFTCPADGLLDNIQVYSSAVQNPGELHLTLHVFDEVAKNWGVAIGNAVLPIEKGDDAKWIRFHLPSVSLKQGTVYGFRLQTRNALIGIGEAVTGTQQPFTGHEWNADSLNERGRFYSYFSLAFKVEMCA